jgi:hypothetical protein
MARAAWRIARSDAIKSTLDRQKLGKEKSPPIYSELEWGICYLVGG